jgi:hypothetical protein
MPVRARYSTASRNSRSDSSGFAPAGDRFAAATRGSSSCQMALVSTNRIAQFLHEPERSFLKQYEFVNRT